MNRYVLRGGIVLSLDPEVGDFDRADVLVEDDRIRGQNTDAPSYQLRP